MSDTYARAIRLVPKLMHALARHRAHVFDENAGDAHTRCILRLKKTATFRALEFQNQEHARERQEQRLIRMGY